LDGGARLRDARRWLARLDGLRVEGRWERILVIGANVEIFARLGQPAAGAALTRYGLRG
jgi:hypothetical protein